MMAYSRIHAIRRLPRLQQGSWHSEFVLSNTSDCISSSPAFSPASLHCLHKLLKCQQHPRESLQGTRPRRVQIPYKKGAVGGHVRGVAMAKQTRTGWLTPAAQAVGWEVLSV